MRGLVPVVRRRSPDNHLQSQRSGDPLPPSLTVFPSMTSRDHEAKINSNKTVWTKSPVLPTQVKSAPESPTRRLLIPNVIPRNRSHLLLPFRCPLAREIRTKGGLWTRRIMFASRLPTTPIAHKTWCSARGRKKWCSL